jgi:hypothetical protein
MSYAQSRKSGTLDQQMALHRLPQIDDRIVPKFPLRFCVFGVSRSRPRFQGTSQHIRSRDGELHGYSALEIADEAYFESFFPPICAIMPRRRMRAEAVPLPIRVLELNSACRGVTPECSPKGETIGLSLLHFIFPSKNACQARKLVIPIKTNQIAVSYKFVSIR